MVLVENEWDRNPDAAELEDLLFVTYDAAKVDLEQMLQLIAKRGLDAELRK